MSRPALLCCVSGRGAGGSGALPGAGRPGGAGSQGLGLGVQVSENWCLPLVARTFALWWFGVRL